MPSPAVAVELIKIIEKQVVEQNENRHGFDIKNFDQWVFGNRDTVDGAKKQLLTRLRGEAAAVESTFQLTDDQKQKLLLAGRGDIGAFLRQYAEIRAKFSEKLNDQQAFQNLWQEIQPLQLKYHGRIYGDGSLFTKVQGQLLNEKQSVRLEEIRRDQRDFQYRATIMQLVSQFDQAAPFTHEKREKLLALIEQQTLPPKSMGVAQQQQFLMYYVLSQMAEIPVDQLRPLFEESTWKIVQQQMRRGKAMQRNLQQHGLVPDK